jgi:hypothetical protein
MNEKETFVPDDEASMWRRLEGRSSKPPYQPYRRQHAPGRDDDEPIGVLAILAASTWGRHHARFAPEPSKPATSRSA